MVRITNAVLAEKIDNLHQSVDELKENVRENTKFRHQAKGIIGFISFASMTLGGLFLWIINKIWK